MWRFLAILFLVSHTSAATWYVRPCVWTNIAGITPYHPLSKTGVYGLQDGTSYANAWNGLQDVKWGEQGVTNGDTLYVCGTHIYSVSNIVSGPYFQAYIIISNQASGCTIRGDYPGDSGGLFGGCFMWAKDAPWEGPDVNGVYRCTNWWGANYTLCYEVNGTTITRLNQSNVNTWAGGLGAWSRVGDSNFVKTTSGAAPGTNIAMNAYGWRFIVANGLSNVTFQSLMFISSAFKEDDYNYAVGYPPLNCRANHLTFTNCVWKEWGSSAMDDAILVGPKPGNDYWTFTGCTLSNGPSGIYTGGGYQDGTNQMRGCQSLVVTNCYIHDLDTANYSTVDGHAVGISYVNDAVVVNNRTERTGTAIALYTQTREMTNCLVENNFVKDVHWHVESGSTGGSGIWISSQSSNTTQGTKIIGNVVLNCGLPGIGSYDTSMGDAIHYSGPDYIEILNNTVWNANYGIYVGVNSPNPPNCKILNNIIGMTTNELIHVGNLTSGDVTCDYNLFYTNFTAHAIYYFTAPIPTHDAHSITNNPLFIVSNPLSSIDFRLNQSSPAINSGTNVGLPYCQSAPDIGAIEFCNQLLLNTLKANNVRISP